MDNYYLYYIILVMLVLPVLSIFIDIYFFRNMKNRVELMAKWFIFWGIGIRQLTAGVCQTLNPAFTAKMLQLTDSSFVAINEIGFANFSIGMTAVIALFLSSWRKPAGFCGGLYLGIAGVFHITRIAEGMHINEVYAMISDIFILIIIIIFLIHTSTDRKVVLARRCY